MLKPVASTNSGALCLFQCQARPYAVHLQFVAEVISVEHLVRLPLSPPKLLGLCTLRREVVPVIGLTDGRLAAPAEKTNLVLVLQARQELWGIRIDRKGTVFIEEGPEKAGADGETARGLDRIHRGATAYTLIDPEEVWRDVRGSLDQWYGLGGPRAAAAQAAAMD